MKVAVDHSKLSSTTIFAAIACFFNIKKFASSSSEKDVADAGYSRFHDNMDFDAASYKSGRFMLSSHTGKDSVARLDATAVCSLRTSLYGGKVA